MADYFFYAVAAAVLIFDDIPVGTVYFFELSRTVVFVARLGAFLIPVNQRLSVDVAFPILLCAAGQRYVLWRQK
jgi:hypothetical protein